MVNGTITEGVQVLLHQQSIPLWVRVLALFGGIYLFNIVTKTGVSLVVMIAYLIGFVKFIYNKIKKN